MGLAGKPFTFTVALAELPDSEFLRPSTIDGSEAVSGAHMIRERRS